MAIGFAGVEVSVVLEGKVPVREEMREERRCRDMRKMTV